MRQGMIRNSGWWETLDWAHQITKPEGPPGPQPMLLFVQRNVRAGDTSRVIAPVPLFQNLGRLGVITRIRERPNQGWRTLELAWLDADTRLADHQHQKKDPSKERPVSRHL